jgi:uncharacterized protein
MPILSNNSLLIFMKWPEPGRVKTRLSEHLGTERASALYQCFVQDVVEQSRLSPVKTVCCYDPPHRETRFTEWLGPDLLYQAQTGINLGPRLENAFRQRFDSGDEYVIAIGTDSPDLPESYLTEAWKELGLHDCVIGPCHDGGYYLIGFTRNGFTTDCFRDIDWSTERVYAQTMRVLQCQHKLTHELPLWYDIDTIGDMKALLERTKLETFSDSDTMQFIRQHQWHEPGRFHADKDM